MLDEAPSNYEAMCVANIVMNEAPTSHDTTHVVNEVRLTCPH